MNKSPVQEEMERDNMCYSMLNEKLRIQACNTKDLALDTKKEYEEQFNGGKIESLTFFYDPRSDVITINLDNERHEFYNYIIVNYLEFDEDKRKRMKEEVSSRSLSKTLDLIDTVVKRRETLKKDNEARRIIKMLQAQGMDTFLNAMDILDAFERVDKHYYSFRDYDAFMYGYIEGKRAERARRKAK